MKVLILMGSPRRQGNTAALLGPFTETLREKGAAVETLWLYEKDIRPCIACRNCQKDWTRFGCIHRDDMQEVFDAVLAADLLVFATPIYCWFCTPPMKAALDRLMYGMNKFYGVEKGPSIWSGKRVALLSTCGYRPEKGADLWEEGMRRYCKHSGLNYAGDLALRDLGYNTEFATPEKLQQARDFANRLSAY